MAQDTRSDGTAHGSAFSFDTQIREADRRLVTSQGEGGPNFVRNAILGPLADKRVATINRIATAIGRHAPRPQGLDALAPCTLSKA